MRPKIERIVKQLSEIDTRKVDHRGSVGNEEYVFTLWTSGTELLFSVGSRKFDNIYVQLTIPGGEEISLTDKEQRHLKVALLDFIDRSVFEDWQRKESTNKHLYSCLNVDV